VNVVLKDGGKGGEKRVMKCMIIFPFLGGGGGGQRKIRGLN